MRKETARLILYQLEQANHTLAVAASAEESRAQGIVKAFLLRRATGVHGADVKEFFALSVARN